MNKQLKTFAILGLVSVVFFLVGNLYAQFSWKLYEKIFWPSRIDLDRMSPMDLDTLREKAILCYRCGYRLICLLAYFLLDSAYLSISGIRRTSKVALWGMVGCRLCMVGFLIGMACTILLGVQDASTASVERMQYVFYFVGFAALGFSALSLGRSMMGKRFSSVLCALGAIGWLCVLVDDGLLLVNSSLRAWYLRHVNDLRTAYISLHYVVDALILLPFVAVLLDGRSLSSPVDADAGSEDKADDGPEAPDDWIQFAKSVSMLFFAAIPLCILPLCIRYPFFDKHLLFVSYRKNVLFFKSFCVGLGIVTAIGNLAAILPRLNRANIGRMVGAWGGVLKKFVDVLGAGKRLSPVVQRDSSALKRETDPRPCARQRLVELKQLLDEGLITQAEFDQKRASILAEM